MLRLRGGKHGAKFYEKYVREACDHGSTSLQLALDSGLGELAKQVPAKTRVNIGDVP